MTSFFPDLNVWVALSVAGHAHTVDAWKWVNALRSDARLLFCRYTQIGLLRLLSNSSVMGSRVLSLEESWEVYQQWLADPRVVYFPEPRTLDVAFRDATMHFASQPASKWVGDCYLLAYAAEVDATLVTFDKQLVQFARKHRYPAVSPRAT
jgi:toxin-antitoxin system PIN domain toxin